MKTKKATKLIHRLTVYIELIDRSTLRIEQQKQNLIDYDNESDIYSSIKLFKNRYDIEDMINKYERIKVRLERSYNNILLQLNYDAIDNLNFQLKSKSYVQQ